MIEKLRNIAIIAHVDHGKTTLVDKLLQQSGTFDSRAETQERVMDSNDLEKERGITILAKNTAIKWNDYRINIVDTPGHADFGGEVERVMSMVDSVLLVVDAFDGPMPQTRFVTKKAFAYGLKPIVVINKVDRPGARPDWVVDQVFDLFVNLDATDEQLDFPIVYASALNGIAGLDHEDMAEDMTPLYQAIVDHVPAPDVDLDGPFQMQISQLDYNSYVGVIGIGRIKRGKVKPNQQVTIIDSEGKTRNAKVGKVLGHLGLERIETDLAEAGDIVAITGLGVLEIDAASNNGVDNVRDLRDDAIYTPSQVKMRVYIIDEVHMLSISAFNALLKIIEEPPEHLLFILATTELHKVPATILSRCQRFSFRRISQEDIAARLQYVAYQENIDLDDGAARVIARLADGGMRDGLSLLDQCASATTGELTAERVYACLGIAGERKCGEMMGYIAAHDTKNALELFNRLYTEGKDLGAMLDEMACLTRDLLVLKTAGNAGITMLSGVASDKEALELTKALTSAELVRMMERLQETMAGFTRSASRRMDAELCIVELCQPELSLDTKALNARLTRLEEQVKSGAFVPAAPVKTEKGRAGEGTPMTTIARPCRMTPTRPRQRIRRRWRKAKPRSASGRTWWRRFARS